MTPRRRKLLASAARDAQALHAEWKESVRQHQVRLEAQFKELARRLKVRPSGKQPPGLPTAKQAETLEDMLGKARLKPGKGRAKDLRRVEQLMQDMLARLPDAD